MFATLDIHVNYFDESKMWIVTPQTLLDIDDGNEQADQSSFDGADFNNEKLAMQFANDLAKYAISTNQTIQAVIFLNGKEVKYYGPRKKLKPNPNRQIQIGDRLERKASDGTGWIDWTAGKVNGRMVLTFETNEDIVNAIRTTRKDPGLWRIIRPTTAQRQSLIIRKIDTRKIKS